MMSHKKDAPLDELLDQILRWKVEAASGHNDGWTRQHYLRMLGEVKRTLNKALQDIEDGEELDNYD